jgi:hypothetical protein
MSRAGFETATPATKRPQTYALDRTATGIGQWDTHLSYFTWKEQVSLRYSPFGVVLLNLTFKI